MTFANERTFLAWMRTSLALIGAGLAIIQLLPPFDLPGGRHLIGVPLVALGSITAWTSLRHWALTERALRLGRPPPPARLSIVVAGTVAIIGILAVVIATVQR